MKEHLLPSHFLNESVRVALVGCGGSGSQMLTALARLHLSLIALGHPRGLHVTTYDPDQVSAANVGRQLFAPTDVGQSKANVLTHRLNCYYGLSWTAVAERFSKGYNPCPLVIACVDTRSSRREIVQEISGFTTEPRYYLDLGNDSHTGQVLLGQVGGRSPRLPHALEMFPELSLPGEDRSTPSCSLAQSLQSQSLFINQAVVTFAASLLYQLFTEGKIAHQGAYINLRSGRVRPIPVSLVSPPDSATS